MRTKLLLCRLIGSVFAQIAILLGNLGFTKSFVFLSPGGFEFLSQIPRH